MKLLFVTASAPFGSGEVFTAQEILALMNDDVNLVIAPRSYGSSIEHKFAEQLVIKSLSFHFLSIKTFFIFMYVLTRNPLVILRSIIWNWHWAWGGSDFFKSLIVIPKACRVAWELKYESIDHIHATNTNTMIPMVYLISNILGVKWSFTLHSWWPRFFLRKKSFEVAINSAAFCRVISHQACAQLKLLIDPRLHAKCHAIHIGTQCEVTSRAAIKSSTSVVNIVTPACIEAHKGPSIAMEAADLLLKAGFSNFHWYFYGDGSLRSQLSTKLEKSDIKNNFSFPGVLSNDTLLSKYRNGDVNLVVLPSIEKTGMPEGIPYALIQAMGFGVPVIATNSGGTTELIGDEAGIIIDQNDAISLANAIIKLVNDESYYLEMSRNAILKIKSQFDEKSTVSQLRNLFSIY